MIWKYIKILICFLLALLTISITGVVFAEDYYRIDVFVLMDSSESMKSTDPDGVRFKAFEELAGQLEVGDRIGLFQFGTSSKLVFHLTDIDMKNSSNNLSQEKIPQDNLVYTNVLDVLSKGYQEMQSTYDSEHLPFFILLTDGEIDPNDKFRKDEDFKSQYLSELREVANKYKSRKWPIYAVNINMQGERGDTTLKEISELTGGYMVNIQSPQAITSAFQDFLKSIRIKKIGEEKKIQNVPVGNASVELRVTSPDPGDYALSDDIEIHGEIIINGRRVRASSGSFLEIEEIYALVADNNNNKTRIELVDNGLSESGDLKEGDGIYSAYYMPKQQGNLSFYIYASGQYKGEPFDYMQEVSGLKAVAPENVIITSLTKERLVLHPGEEKSLFLKAQVLQVRMESIKFQLLDPVEMDMKSDTFYLGNNKNNIIELKISVPKSIHPGEKGELIIQASSDNIDSGGTQIDIKVPYIIEQNKAASYIVIILVIAAAALITIWMVRRLLTRVKLQAGWVKGTLYFRKDEDERIQKVELDFLNKERIHLCSTAGKGVDVVLDTDEDIDFEIYSEAENGKINYFITGGVDNILYINDMPSKTLNLVDRQLITIKSYKFCYYNPVTHLEENEGNNILKKYEF